MKLEFFSPGKLLLTGEYFVLDQAVALALPTRLGQHLHIKTVDKKGLTWKSLDAQGNCWYEAYFESNSDGIFTIADDDLSATMSKIFQQAQQLNPDFFTEDLSLEATAQLEFPRNWGLGSSATLINNIAQWAQVSPYLLNDTVFGGSGYDIATAQHKRPLLYQRSAGGPLVQEVNIQWPFTDQLFFVHLNEKQDSRQGIAQFERTPSQRADAAERIGTISQELLQCSRLSDFEQLLEEHEALVSERIHMPTVKTTRFSDYPGVVKSLGAWGGDFILATGGPENFSYFIDRGYSTLLPYQEMIA